MNEATRRAVDWGMRWAMGEDMIGEKERPRTYDWDDLPPHPDLHPDQWNAPLPRDEHLFIRGVIAGVIAEAVAVVICAAIIWSVWG